MLVYQGSDAQKTDIQIQSPFTKLGFHITGAAGAITKAELQAARISISKSGSGNNVLIPEIDLKTALEIGAIYEGLYTMKDTELFGTIPFSANDEAINSTQSDYFSLKFSGFQTDWTVKIFAIDAPTLGNTIIVPRSIATNNQKILKIDSRGLKALFIPKDANLINAQVTYNVLAVNQTSRSIIFTPEELEFNMQDTNELVMADARSLAANVTVVSEDWLILPCIDAVEITLQFPDNTAKYLYSLTNVKL